MMLALAVFIIHPLVASKNLLSGVSHVSNEGFVLM